MKIVENQSIILSLKSCLLTFLLVTVSLFSCKRNGESVQDHPEYFDKVFARADGISNVDPARAITFIDSFYQIYPDVPGIKDLYRKYEYRVNYYLEDYNSLPIVMLNLDSMFWVLGVHAQEKDFAKEYGNALVKKGNALMAGRNYASAFEYNYKARQVIEKINDTCLLSTYSFMLALVCFKQGKYLEGARYDVEAVREAKSCPLDFRLFRTIQARLDDIGFAYVKSGMPDSGLYYFNAAINYLDENKDKFPEIPNHEIFIEVARGVVYGNMGDAYLQKGDTLTAEKCYRLDRNIYGEPGFDPGDGRCTQLKIASLYLALNKLPEADKTLNMVRTSLDSSFWVDDELKWLRLKMKYLEMTGHTEKTYPYMKSYLHIKDSLAALPPIPQVDLVKGYEQVKDRYEAALLSSENTRKDYYIAVVLTSSVLAIVIACILWYYWKRSRNLNKSVIKRNNELRLALASLTESEKRNTQVMQIVAHDLKNPVASIISITSIILDNNNVNEEDREMLELMKTSGERSIEMISNILNINTGAAGLVKEPAEIHLLLRYCIDLLQFRAAEKNQRIILSTDEATLAINKEKIWRVISNLIVNAIKFSPEGTEIHVHGKKEQSSFLIEIQDQGIGIPEEMKEKAFQMFTDAKRPGTGGEQSFGLGLAISRQIVTAHGGKIWFESEAGRGSRFFISLPVQP